MRIQLGQTIECSDGSCGTVGDVVIDPVHRAVTYVVVEPRHDHHRARLVPIGAFDRRTPVSLRVRCTAAELARYPEIEETAFLRLGEWPPLDGDWDVGVTTVLSLPYDVGAGIAAPYPLAINIDRMLMAYDRIPAGEVEIRRGSPVDAADGKAIGHVEGVLAGPDGQLTHLVLERGHLWARRELTIPIGTVRRVRTDRVELDLRADEVGALPWVRVHRHGQSVG